MSALAVSSWQQAGRAGHEVQVWSSEPCTPVNLTCTMIARPLLDLAQHSWHRLASTATERTVSSALAGHS